MVMFNCNTGAMNRAHYRIDSSIDGEWKCTDIYLCVFHARRLDPCQRVVVLKAHNGMSRPIDRICSKCQESEYRCEHDVQNVMCPRVPGDTCGRDQDPELGGSW